MFCALKGATLTPSCRRMRQRAAVSTDLPALEQVPWNMRAGVFLPFVIGYSSFSKTTSLRIMPEKGRVASQISASR